jgi:hypothetical protein
MWEQLQQELCNSRQNRKHIKFWEVFLATIHFSSFHLQVSYLNNYWIEHSHVVWLQTRFALSIGFIELLKEHVTTNNYYSLTELHTPKITVTAAHIKPSQYSLAVLW